MKNLLLKALIAIFLVITICSLTACGGGGSSSDPAPTTANVKVSIPGNLFDNSNLTNARANQTVQSLTIRAIPYDNKKGSIVGGVQQITKVASLKDGNYVANFDLGKNFDYRFNVYSGEGANEKVLLQNHIGIASITSGAFF